MKSGKPDRIGDSKTAAPALETYFRNIIVLNQALSADGAAFRDSHAAAQRGAGTAPGRAVLWLGCNVLRTPHLAQLAANVVGLLNPNLSVLGGPAHCCGSPMPDKGDRERALGRTIGHFQSEDAPTLVSWCPSCHTNLRKGSEVASWGFDELHVTEFIASHLDRLKLKPRLAARVMLHGHTGTPDRDKDMEYCRKLLQAMPGVTIVAEHADADLGLHCVPALLSPQIGSEAFERKLAAILGAAREAGAEMLVTIYHSCYRELEKRLSADNPVVENYITLLARALDIAVPANVYREMAHAGGSRLEQLVCEAQVRGLERGEIERAAAAEFPAAAKPAAASKR
jgi:Fe-S oxidoreductase